MDKLKKLKLHDLVKGEMTKKEQGMIKGGDLPEVVVCGCGPNRCPCRYAGTQSGPTDSYYGGSSTADNRSANGSATVNN